MLWVTATTPPVGISVSGKWQKIELCVSNKNNLQVCCFECSLKGYIWLAELLSDTAASWLVGRGLHLEEDRVGHKSCISSHSEGEFGVSPSVTYIPGNSSVGRSESSIYLCESFTRSLGL